jgi:pimeloyl-ACP methyl ester carboxylesterase
MADSINFVDANGLRFAYLEDGSGPLVLLLHGFPDTAHSWDDLRPRLAAQGYRAVSPFMRGYSPSGIPDRDTDQETLARDPLALIEALGAREAIIIGHDFGASAGYGAAALGPDRVKKLFTIAIPHPAALKPSLKKLWGVRHFAGGDEPLRAQRLRRASRHLSAMVPDVEPRSNRVRRRPRELFKPGELECGVRLLPKALPHTQRVVEDANKGARGRLRGPR